MMYHPREKGMWDTWLFHHEGTFHLFYLQSVGGLWSRIGHATSSDLLKWKEEEPALLTGKSDEWDGEAFGTGMVFRKEDKFYMTYCAFKKGEPQKVGLAFSDDLYHWQKHPANPIITPGMGGKLYEADPEESHDGVISWRDAFVWFDEMDGLFHATIAARVSKGNYARRGCIAHATSRDLARWKVLPPLYAPGRYYDHEVPQPLEMDGRFYLIWTSAQLYTNHYETPSRPNCGGTFYALSDQPYSGFTEPEDNLLVGTGLGRMDNYVGRSLLVGDEHILYYQMVGAEVVDLVSAAAPKVLRTTEEGRIWPAYCKRMDGLKKETLSEGVKAEWVGLKKQVEGERWEVEGETVLARVDGSFVLPTDVRVGNFMLEAELMIEEGFFAGLGVSEEGPVWNGIEAGAVLDARRSRVHIVGRSGGRTGPILKPLDSSAFPFEAGKFHHLRIMVRRPWTDVFFDDRLYFSLALPWPEGGRLVLFACDGKARFRNITVSEIE